MEDDRDGRFEENGGKKKEKWKARDFQRGYRNVEP